MYVKHILIEHLGPLRRLAFDFPFHADEKPKPVVLVGQNGSGKSLLLSQLVSALLSGQQHLYDNSEVAKGKSYRYRSPTYISPGQSYYFAKIGFEDGIECIEWQLSTTRRL